MAKRIGITWSTSPLGIIGFVLTEDEITGEKKLRCGVVSGNDATMDAQIIARQGSKAPIEDLKGMIEKVEASTA